MAITYVNSMDHYGELSTNTDPSPVKTWPANTIIGDGWLSDPQSSGSDIRGAYRVTTPAWGARRGERALTADSVWMQNNNDNYSTGKESMGIAVPGGPTTKLMLHFAFSLSDLPAVSVQHGQIVNLQSVNPPLPREGVILRLCVDTTGRLIVVDGSSFYVSLPKPAILAASAGPVIQANTWYSISMEVTKRMDGIPASPVYDINVWIGDISPDTRVIGTVGTIVSHPDNIAIVGFLPASSMRFSHEPYDTTRRAVRDIVFFDETGTENTELPGQIFVSAQSMRAEDNEGDNWQAHPRKNIGAGILDHKTNRTGLKFSDSPDFNLGTGDFTFETFIRFNTVPNSNEIMNILTKWRAEDNRRSYRLYLDGSNDSLVWQGSTTGTNEILVKSVPWTPETNKWYHLAVSRTSGVLQFFINGDELGVGTADTTNYFDGAEPLGLGVTFTSGGNASTTGRFNGWMDETRFTVGVSRYSNNFTPPTAAFGRTVDEDADFNNVVLLLGYDNETISDESSYQRVVLLNTPAVTATLPADGDFSFEVLNNRPIIDDTFIEASLTFAETTLTFTGQPVDGETITLGVQTYTWKDALSTGPTVPNEIKIGADIDESITHLINAVNGGSGAGTQYSTGTTANASVAAFEFLTPQVIFRALIAGASGNSIVTTETMAAASFSGPTLSGGQNIPSPSDFRIERLPLDATSVLGVQATARVFKSMSGSATVRFDLVGPGGGVKFGDAVLADLNPAWTRQIFEIDPDTSQGITPSTVALGRLRVRRTS